jgi:UDP-N-acetyl-D-mannosaminuronic acid dehydrogenase
VSKTPADARLIRAARDVNDHKPHFVLEKVKEAAATLTNPKIACLGLAFKADIDDLRESPALEIVLALQKMNLGQLYVVEPHVSEFPESLQSTSAVFATAAEAIGKADIVLLLVNHRVFLDIDQDHLAGKVLIDTRGLWSVS